MRSLLIALSSGLFIFACAGSSGPETNPPGEELRSDKARITAPDVQDAALAAQVAGNTALALDLYRGLAADNTDNLFFSPHSIEVALAMTWAGAKADTETAMAQALHFAHPQAELHPVFNFLDLALNARGEGAQGKDGEGFRLNVINSIWGQTGYGFYDAFLDVLAENYGAGMRLMDFVADAEGARQVINAWVAEATEDRIEDLIPANALSEYTKLVLVNAIYFNAAWEFPFEVEDTSDGPFQTAAGQTVTVPMMHQSVETRWAEGEDFQAVELPYDGLELSMWIIAPLAGQLSAFEDRLDADLLDAILDTPEYGLVDLAMPRWELDGETFSVKQLLMALGMEVAFTPGADFSGMAGNPGDLMIHDVLHQAFVAVDEAGTEAAAATAVIVGDTGLPPEGPVVTLDRPFLYLIKDNPTGQIVFLGRVTDPS